MSLIVVGVVISFLTLSSYLGNAASENIHVSTKTAKVFKDFSLHEEIDQIVDRVASRMIESIKKIENRESLELLPGITLEKNSSLPGELEKRALHEPGLTPFELLWSATSGLISNRVLKFRVTLNSLNGVSRALNEGRGKMKKMMTPFIFEIATKMITAVPVVFGIVVLLTTKALLVGKLALIISVILFFQIFLSGGSIVSYDGFGGTHGIPPTYGVPSSYGPNFGTNGIGFSQYHHARSINIAHEKI
ncbi:unnamed protein product [Tenebrio molitor]|nr:unnamed protein product [Tenebrio molitor]